MQLPYTNLCTTPRTSMGLCVDQRGPVVILHQRGMALRHSYARPIFTLAPRVVSRRTARGAAGIRMLHSSIFYFPRRLALCGLMSLFIPQRRSGLLARWPAAYWAGRRQAAAPRGFLHTAAPRPAPRIVSQSRLCARLCLLAARGRKMKVRAAETAAETDGQTDCDVTPS